MDGRGGAGQVVDLIGLKIERKRYIVPDDFKTTMIEHALDVTTGSSKIIINANDVGGLLEQTFAEVGAEKSSSSGDQHTGLEVQRQSPSGWAQLPSTPKQVSRSVNIALPDRGNRSICYANYQRHCRYILRSSGPDR
jgi:hypothetical protein